LDAGIENRTVHTFLGGVALPPPEVDAKTYKIPAATMRPAAMMMPLRFILLNRQRGVVDLYGLLFGGGISISRRAKGYPE